MNKLVDIEKAFKELRRSGNLNTDLYYSIMQNTIICSIYEGLNKLVDEQVCTLWNDYQALMDFGENFGRGGVKFWLHKVGEIKNILIGEFNVRATGSSTIENNEEKGINLFLLSDIYLTQEFIEFLMSNTKKGKREIIQNIIDSIKEEGLNKINNKEKYIEEKYGMKLRDFSVHEDKLKEYTTIIKSSTGFMIIWPGIDKRIIDEGIGAVIDVDINCFIPEEVYNLFMKTLRS
jgi:hypothetical protein